MDIPANKASVPVEKLDIPPLFQGIEFLPWEEVDKIMQKDKEELVFLGDWPQEKED